MKRIRPLAALITLLLTAGCAARSAPPAANGPASPDSVIVSVDMSPADGPSTDPVAAAASTVGSAATATVGRAWQALPGAPIRARSQAAYAWTGSELIVWGGLTAGPKAPAGNTLADGAAFEPETGRWRTLAESPLRARALPLFAWTGDGLFIWGGATGFGPGAADGAIYFPATDSWRVLPKVDLDPTWNTQITWTGDRVVIVAADVEHASTVQVRSFDPKSWSWSRLPDIDGPSGARVDGLSVAGVGPELLVWAAWVRPLPSPGRSTEPSHPATAPQNPGDDTSPTTTGAGVTVDVRSGDDAAWTPADWYPADLLPGSAPLPWGSGLLLPVAGPWCQTPRCPASVTRPAVVDLAGQRATVLPAGPIAGAGSAFATAGTGLVQVELGNRSRVERLDVAGRTWTELPELPTGITDFPVLVWSGDALLIWGATPPGDSDGGAEFGYRLPLAG